jgi:glutamyl-tRNA reductase
MEAVMEYWGVGADSTLPQREALIQKGYLRPFQRPPADAVVLQTCDRYEVFYGSGPAPLPLVRRLFRITAGLLSPLLGENAIQGQVKKAYELAHGRSPLTPYLHRLFQQALHTGKRVRRETSLGQGALSHTGILLKILEEKGLLGQKLRIAIIGVNKLTHSLLKSLGRGSFQTILLGNRTLGMAQSLASQHNAQAFALSELRNFLPQCDVVVSATSAPHLMIHSGDIGERGPRLFFDLAVPRDIDPEISGRQDCELWDVSRLETRGTEGMQVRLTAVEAAEGIIQEELERYEEWQFQYQNYHRRLQAQSIS